MSRELAEEVERARDAVAEAVTDTFLSRHRDWVERYGERARTHGVQDARHHIDFLQAAVELDDPATFRNYALWCREVLDARGISVKFLTENLTDISEEMSSRLTTPATEAVMVPLRAALEALALNETSPRTEIGELSPACQLYIAAAITGRRESALAVVREAVDGGATPLDVYIDIFQAALYEVGRRWQTTGLTIAEEHMATATTQFILSVLHEQQERVRSHGGTAVVTGVAGERHAVGASIIANVLDADGWDVRFVGTDLPPSEIVSAIDQAQASLLAISVTISGRVADARDLIAQVHRDSTNPPRIIVGGAGFAHDPHLWQTIGADGFAADARSVAELVRNRPPA